MNTYRKFLLKSSRKSAYVGGYLFAAMVVAGLVGSVTGLADDDHGLKAVPFEFVGVAGDCGTGYAAGSRIVTAKWLNGLGLPNNGGQNSNASDPTNNPNKKDRHSGLLLSKNGPTPDCSAAGATIKGVKGMPVGAGFEMGFDYRNGTHCGAGAPRFNVVVHPVSGPDLFFFTGGCANGTNTPAPQDKPQWTRVRIGNNPAQVFDQFSVGTTIPITSKIVSIDLIFDEGTDTSSPDDPNGVGLAVIDNIDINKVLITHGPGKGEDHHDGKDKDDDDD